MFQRTIKLHKRPRKKSQLIIGLILLVALIGYVITFPPDSILKIALFFILSFTSTFYLLSFGFNNKRRAFLVSSGLAVYLMLRALNLHHWLYPVLIGAIIISLEVYARKK